MDRPDKVSLPYYRPSESAGSLLEWIKYANELQAENDRLRDAAKQVVERMRGSGGINPDAVGALLELAALLEAMNV